MMEAARTSETSVNFYQTTRRYNPEDSHLRTHRRENLKSISNLFFRGSYVKSPQGQSFHSGSWTHIMQDGAKIKINVSEVLIASITRTKNECSIEQPPLRSLLVKISGSHGGQYEDDSSGILTEVSEVFTASP
jgi:hypothetical protein